MNIIEGFKAHLKRVEDARKNDTCVLCLQPAHNFRDDLSVKEYSITAVCQACQDTLFKEEYDEA